MRSLIAFVFAFTMLAGLPAHAGSHMKWVSEPGSSHLAFGSVKKNKVGEVHYFKTLTGMVKENGDFEISVDLASIDTNIEIRDTRIKRHVFGGDNAAASITGKIDMSALNALKPGEMKVIDVEANLNLAGHKSEVETEVLVVRLAENRVLVSSNDFMMLSTSDLGINAGIDMLKKLAKLNSITRVTPVSIRMVFKK